VVLGRFGVKPVLDCLIQLAGPNASVSRSLAARNCLEMAIDSGLKAGGGARSRGLVGRQRAQECGRNGGRLGSGVDPDVAALEDPQERLQVGLRSRSSNRS